jgi:aryl-alcohol dehydrogenase-like predicted oxidoreductase
VSVQNQLSLLKREGAPEVLAKCEQLGIAFIPYFPLASGLLSGKYRKGSAVPEGTRIQAGSDQLSDSNLETVERLVAYAESRGHTILELAISWLLAQQSVASVICGATKPSQVQSNALAGNWKLSNEELAEIESILPTPAMA